MSIRPSGAYIPLPQPQPYGSPPIAVVLTVIILIFCFIGFFTLFFCKCILETMLQSWQHQTNPSENPGRSSDAPPANPGLDPDIIQMFPTFPYSSVKSHRSETYGLECAICLSEFADDDVLRLLTTCYHVFHQECVDLWLQSHKTCPVCRRELEPSSYNNKSPFQYDTIIDIIQEHEDSNDISRIQTPDVRSGQNSDRSKREQYFSPEKFPRSHSTGHSIVRNKPEEEDRYTLRLPEHVKIKITRGHNQTESCITFGELTRNRGCKNSGFGEVSGQTNTTQSEEN